MGAFAAIASETVPAWAAVLIAVITGGGVVAAAVYGARAARARLQSELRARAEEVATQLQHERAMRVRDEHRTALDDAAVIGVRFRERLATAVRQVEGSEHVPAGAVKPLALDREDLIELRGAEARLVIRLGAEHEATASFRAFREVVTASVILVREARNDPAAGRDWTKTPGQARAALDRYLEAARRTLEENAMLGASVTFDGPDDARANASDRAARKGARR